MSFSGHSPADSHRGRMSPCAGGAGDGRRCLLCSKESLPSHLSGQVSKLGHGVEAHELCIKFAKGIKNKKIVIGKTRLQEEVARARNVVCVFCQKPGAASGCWKPFCPVSFHLDCSLGQQVIHRHDIFMSSCWQHSRTQSLLLNRNESSQCEVCGWRVEDGVSFYSLVSPCCKHAHHRDCLQVLGSLGISSCPSCNNVKSYQSEMIVNGIFFNDSFNLPSNLDKSLLHHDTSDLRSSKSTKIADFSLRDSGISLSPPLTASTPIILENDKSSKRKSLSDTDSEVCNTSKRQKSVTETSEGQVNPDSTILELRPVRKLLTDVSEDPLVEMDDCEDDMDMKSICKVLSVEDIIELDDEEEIADDLEVKEDQIVDDVDMTVSIYSETIDEDETDLDEDDVAEFREVTKGSGETSSSVSSEVKDTSTATSEEDRSLKEGDEPAKFLCLSEEKLLAMKRKQVLKKIRKLPISERFILHGRNLLPWKQKFENYSECNSEWMDNYDNEKIDEIIDLNQGEKSFMKLWNDHVRNYSGLGVKHMDTVVMRFIEASGVKILEQNIYRNFVAHLSSLVGAEFIGADTQIRALMQIQQLMRDIDVEKLNENWKRSLLNRSTSCLAETPKSAKSRHCHVRLRSETEKFLQGERRQTERGRLSDKSSERMPVLCQESCQSSCASPDLHCSPEMPILVPQQELIDKNTNPGNTETGQKLTGELSTVRRGRGRPRKLSKIKKKLLESSPSSSKLRAPRMKVRENQSRKAKEKTEIEFAIKRSKKQRLKVGNKLAQPLKSKLRKNFKFSNEQ